MKRMMSRRKLFFWGDAVRAEAGLWAAAASAAATAGKMEGISSGCGLQAGGWRGPAATWRPAGPIRAAAVRGGGVGLRSLLSGFGRAGLLQCGRVCVFQRPRGETVRVDCIWVSGGLGLGLRGCVGGACPGHLERCACRGAWGSSQRVCVGCQRGSFGEGDR